MTIDSQSSKVPTNISVHLASARLNSFTQFLAIAGFCKTVTGKRPEKFIKHCRFYFEMLGDGFKRLSMDSVYENKESLVSWHSIFICQQNFNYCIIRSLPGQNSAGAQNYPC